jgi:hypothetical protein
MKRGTKHTEETKQKQREAKLGRSLSWEHRQKIGQGNLGKTHTKETRQKMSKAHKGKIITEEQRQKIRHTLTGKIPSELARQKQSNALRGKAPSEATILASTRAKTGTSRPAEVRQELSRQGRRAHKIFVADCEEINNASQDWGHASPLTGLDYHAKRRIIRNTLRKGLK